MQYIDARKEYKRLFHFDGIGYFINCIWMEGYKELDGLTVSIKDDTYNWLPTSVIEQTLNSGVALFTDERAFESNFAAHEKFLEDLRGYFLEHIQERDTIDLESVQQFISLLTQIWRFYYKTEFFFTDRAYQVSLGEPEVAARLSRYYKLKERARSESINALCLGEQSYENVLLDTLAAQFSVPKSDLRYYAPDEICDLFVGKKIDDRIISDRKAGRILYAVHGAIKTYVGDAVVADIRELLAKTGESELPSTSVLKGLIASKGIARGRVKVIISDANTFSRLGSEIDAMNQGDILVAESTSPELIPACRKAGAILANQGGMLSHAAVISRELKIPCLVGLRQATEVFKDGDMVEVDAEKGIVRKI